MGVVLTSFKNPATVVGKLKLGSPACFCLMGEVCAWGGEGDGDCRGAFQENEWLLNFEFEMSDCPVDSCPAACLSAATVVRLLLLLSPCALCRCRRKEKGGHTFYMVRGSVARHMCSECRCVRQSTCACVCVCAC